MADRTSIEWTDATWNPIVGCSVLSQGCTNCYAMRLAGTRLKHHPIRAGLTVDTKAGPVWTGETRLDEKALLQPLRWKRPRRIFVCAHSDLFHENTPDAWIDRAFAIMALCPQHTFQVLTKRPERMRSYFSALTVGDGYRPYVHRKGWTATDPRDQDRVLLLSEGQTWPLPNVWLGVTAEDQTRADERIPILLDTPAAKRFVSVEPMLGAVDLTRLDMLTAIGLEKDGLFPEHHFDALRGRSDIHPIHGADPGWPALDWVICGGESGPKARPMHPDWACGLRDQCAAARVPFLFKQRGEWKPLSDVGGGWWPEDERSCIRIRRDGTRGEDGWPLQRVGKRAAGRLLDGLEHLEFPKG